MKGHVATDFEGLLDVASVAYAYANEPDLGRRIDYRKRLDAALDSLPFEDRVFLSFRAGA